MTKGPTEGSRSVTLSLTSSIIPMITPRWTAGDEISAATDSDTITKILEVSVHE